MSRKSTAKFRLDFSIKASSKPLNSLNDSDIDLDQILSELKMNGYLKI